MFNSILSNCYIHKVFMVQVRIRHTANVARAKGTNYDKTFTDVYYVPYLNTKTAAMVESIFIYIFMYHGRLVM